MKTKTTVVIASLAAIVGALTVKYLPDDTFRIASAHEKYRSIVRGELLDPNSAEFRNERISKDLKFNEDYYCGEMNAKNRMGGYIGFKRVLVKAKDGSSVMEDHGTWGDTNSMSAGLLLKQLKIRRTEEGTWGNLTEDEKAKLAESLAFDEVWREVCGAEAE